MIINGNLKAVESSGLGNPTQAFKIEQNHKLFLILSDKLYKDKPLALIRELGCNAHDAHVAAGNKAPFEVHLPNDLEPWLEIRDFGTGLSHDDIMGLYTTYGKSTKDQSNEFIGAMGIGSKSPFAYTQSFTVESRFNGELRQYVAMVNKGEPVITLVKTIGTNEPNGITIKVPVKTGDKIQFAEAAKKVYSYFNPQPIIKGWPNFQFNALTHSVKGTGWSLSEYSYGRGTLNAVMGNVPYPIDISVVSSGASTDYSSFSYFSGDIRFELGEIDVAASREELSYDPNTLRVIRNKLDFIRKEVATLVENEIASAKSEYEACRIYAESGEIFRKLTRNTSKLKYKGKDIDSYIRVPMDSADVEVYSLSTYDLRKKSLSLSNHSFPINSNITIYPKQEPIFLVQTAEDNRVPSKLLNWYKTTSAGSSVLLIRDFKNIFVPKLKSLGIDNFVDFATLPEPPKKAKVQSSSVKTAGIYTLKAPTNTWGTRPVDYWSPASVDPDNDTGLYVDLRDYESGEMVDRTFYKLAHGSHNLKNFVDNCVNAGIIKSDKIIGVNGATKNPLDGHKNWTNLFEYVRKEGERLIKASKKSLRYIDFVEALSNVDRVYSNVISLTSDKCFTEFKKRLKDKNLVSILDLMEKADKTVTPRSADRMHRFERAISEKLIDKYPMLCLVKTSIMYGADKDIYNNVSDYVILTDQLKGK